jgi:DNA-binding NarL/FixJ family response regulator
MNKIRVLIADDHKLLREGLSFVINAHPDFEVIACCENSQEAVEITGKEKPDVVLMDINIEPFSGIEATHKIKGLSPSSKVIGLSVQSEPLIVKKMVKMGARGFVTKNSPKDEIINAMKRVINGEIYICQDIKNILGERLGTATVSATGLSMLSDTELQIVELIGKGQSTKGIAVTTGMAVKMIVAHRHKILQKLKLKNAASLVNFAYCSSHGHIHNLHL